MSSRYDNVDVFINSNAIYYNTFKDRGVRQLQQYGTRHLKFPTGEQITELNIISHPWVYGDRYSNLAHEHYGDVKLWWVIAAASDIGWGLQCPPGTFLRIPTDLGIIS